MSPEPIGTPEILRYPSFEQAREAWNSSRGQDREAERSMDTLVSRAVAGGIQDKLIEISETAQNRSGGNLTQAAEILRKNASNIENTLIHGAVQGSASIDPNPNFSRDMHGMAAYIIEGRASNFEAQSDKTGQIDSRAHVLRTMDEVRTPDYWGQFAVELKQLVHSGVIEQSRMDSLLGRNGAASRVEGRGIPASGALSERIGTNMNSISDPRLLALIGVANRSSDSQALQQQLNILRETHLRAIMGTPGTVPFDQSQYDIVEANLALLAAATQPRSPDPVRPPQQDVIQNQQSTVDMLAQAIHGERLTKDEKYREFLTIEQWNGGEIVPINFEIPPAYYLDMTQEERETFKSRIELAKAARYKRASGPPGLETLNKYTEWGNLKKEGTKRLYETPGVRQAMEMYVGFLMTDQNANGIGFSLRGAKDERQLALYRQHIRQEIARSVSEGWRSKYDHLDEEDDKTKYERRGLDQLDVNGTDLNLVYKCRDAEQIAFNLLYAGNVFESLDSKWENGRRVRAPEISSPLANPIVRDQMNPMDALVASFKKDSSSVSWVGNLGEWAYKNVLKENRGRRLSGDEQFVIVPDDDPNDFWKIRGNTVLVPGCYPLQMVKSFWEDTSVRGGNGESNMMDFIANGRPIEWDKVEGDTIWGAYSSRLGKGSGVWEILDGAKPLDSKGLKEWKAGVDKVLSKFGLRNEKNMKRWFIYASAGVRTDKQKPHLAVPSNRQILRFGLHKESYLSRTESLFSWDNPMF